MVFSDLLVEQLRKLQPAQAVSFSMGMLSEVDDMLPGWSVADWLLEKIPGSAYEFSYREDSEAGYMVFSRRHEALPSGSGLRTYVSPDVRHWFRQRPDGLWERKRKQL